MKSEKLVAGIAVGVIAALILIPKTRKMMTGVLGRISDSFKNIAEDASELAERGSEKLNLFAESAHDLAGSVK